MQAWHKWLWLAGWLPTVAAAFHPLVTDDTGTQGADGNQLEFSYSRTIEQEPGTRAVTSALPLVYTRGLGDAVDVYIGGSWVHISPPRMTHKPALATRWLD